MRWIEDQTELEVHYGSPGAPSLRKVARHLTPLYRDWIMASKFCVLTTVGTEGTDGSPRGDDGPVVLELDPGTLALPDWRGNNRLDSLRNIVTDGRVSLMFMVAGSNTVVRVNGRARLTDDAGLRARFDKDGRQPATVIVIRIAEVYTQCARALIRSGLWTAAQGRTADLPTPGQILAEVTSGEEGGAAYDGAWGERAAKTMW
ncbi:pyridoxamine 5'-phosphate oxidase family protein [Sulfitobacter sabulilitoris]|uniref:Pyridoxamine 5'-phosphate oxidase family protein n=1 Tax=Sulfitobacter sabulilitoris TaxID=2562655 RepID=A0A5S3PI20_9RHOB|nr:pyridoxamine 5'-phosphate oxidase family protein [Sulfitobacter sabulilitoris]TMM51585.1 pyridoxamine 5'-phosphate oxidase family protein [Sulfitobacter sabulilitoris]